MDTSEMEKFIDTILVPFMQERFGTKCLLILDSFSVHRSDTIKNKLEHLGFDLLFIPTGMTGLLQPLDIAVNKPFKDRLKTSYSAWLEEQCFNGLLGLRRPKPKREDLAMWMAESWSNIEINTIKSSFNIFRTAMEEHSIAEILEDLG